MTDHPVTNPEPWPGWLADLDPAERVSVIVDAVKDRYMPMGDGAHQTPASAAKAFLLAVLEEARQQAHYLSTSCFHGEHGYCQSGTGAAEGGETWSKVPAKCKFCPATCRCGCHSGEAAAAAEPVSFAAALELRSQIADALGGFLDLEQATIAADSVMVVVVPALRMRQGPVPSAEHSQAISALHRLALEDPMTELKPGNHAWLALEAEMTARREHAAGTLETLARLAAMPEQPREAPGGDPAAEVPSEPVMELLESAWSLICDITSSAVTVPDGWIERAGTWHGRYWDLVREYAAAVIATAPYGGEPEHRGGFCSLCGNTSAGDLGAAIGICLDGKACRWRQSALMRNARERDIARADAAEQRSRIAAAVTLIRQMNAGGVATGITGELMRALTNSPATGTGPPEPE